MSPQIVITAPYSDASEASAVAPAAERLRINCSWLVKLRWAGGLGQLITILVVALGMGIKLPLVPLITLVGVQFLTNLVLQFWVVPRLLEQSVAQPDYHADWLLGCVLVVDILLLSGLLYFSGGQSNPFSIFYLVNIALGGVLLRPPWAWSVALLAVACYVGLGFAHVSIPALGEPWPAGQLTVENVTLLANQRQLFQQGLLVALITCAGFVVYFITRVTHELSHRDAQLSRAQREKAESDKLEALGTLAAGAAHELATPLSTIAIVAKELQTDLEARGADQDVVGDARLIRNEVDHCRRILDVMASDAGETTGETQEWISLEALLKETRDGLSSPGPARVRLELDPSVAKRLLLVPRQGVAQALRGLLKNGLDATGDEGDIVVRAAADDTTVSIQITDSGSGMPPDVLERAGNPFFTTKEPGSGMGLGLFLARKVVQRQRGTMRIESTAGQGTTITVALPAVGHPPEDA